MKTLDMIVIALFVIALIILCFFQQCSLDIFFLIFGFAIAIMSAFTLYSQGKKTSKENNK